MDLLPNGMAGRIEHLAEEQFQQGLTMIRQLPEAPKVGATGTAEWEQEQLKEKLFPTSPKQAKAQLVSRGANMFTDQVDKGNMTRAQARSLAVDLGRDMAIPATVNDFIVQARQFITAHAPPPPHPAGE